MSSEGLTIMRLILAAINGALFAFGVFVLVEYVHRRPKQARARMKRLIMRAERAELAEKEGRFNSEGMSSQELREEIKRIRDALAKRFRSPKVLMNITFGVLMIVLAILSLLNLLFPAWLPFV
ncbi:MAG: hypothetical protein MAG453_02014 [Calditrichaeota bacterium]|nr:hypothetical protein [Calditrichota bacterium]